MAAEELVDFVRIQKPSQPLIESSLVKLHDLAEKYLPTRIQEMIKKSDSTFYQIIYDSLAPSVNKDNIGDASKILRPHVGSGAAEGIRQAFDLASQIEKSASLKEAISNWTLSENVQSRAMVELARRLGDALVINPPTWETMNQARMDQWWATVMTGRLWYFVDHTD